jgi:hypothetical protein
VRCASHAAPYILNDGRLRALGAARGLAVVHHEMRMLGSDDAATRRLRRGGDRRGVSRGGLGRGMRPGGEAAAGALWDTGYKIRCL